ncbi:hypothetical protein [Brachybacterium subflavum]|uniref:hypothetical protein n=1 Tax=Brachybacterium subflavum TaxID=2585206 RepID=UPI00126683D8|nr:hypothetical protein [Brachybacterium subflavum]
MSENDAPQAPRRHGRRARQLTPEETAEQRALAAQHTGELPATGDGPSPAPGDDDAAAASGPETDGPASGGSSGAASGDASAPSTEARGRTPGAAHHAASSGGAGTSGAFASSEALPSGRPSSRGAVASPTADAPVPKLRKFGKRARIIEVEPEEPTPSADSATTAEAPSRDRDSEHTAESEPVDPSTKTLTSEPSSAAGESPVGGDAGDADADAAHESSSDGSAQPTGSGAVIGSASAGAQTAGTSTAAIERDADGVELGEMGVGEAPGPKPAPRFDGRVLNRPEQGRGKPLLWVVWVLIALAIIALVVLLATGVLGPGSDQALAAPLRDALHSVAPVMTAVPTDLEVTSA